MATLSSGDFTDGPRHSQIDGTDKISAHRKPHKPSRGGALIVAGLAVAVVSAGIGGGAAMAVRPHIPALSTMATAAAPVAQPTASAPAGWIEQIAAKVVPSVVQLQIDLGRQADDGSGIILNANGLIMTNTHVVSAAANAGAGGAGGAGGAHTLVTFA